MTRQLERGTSLTEALAATVLGIVAALAMVYALSSGNASIQAMRIERAAITTAQQKMEKLLAKPTGDAQLSVGNHGPESVTLPYKTGQTSWVVAWQDDPIDGSGVGDTDPQDYKKLTVTVSWTDAIARSTSMSTFLYP